MEIGNFVRTERKRQGLTQQQLAARSGVGLNFVYQLEKNKASVQLDSVNQVLRALGYQIGVIRDFRPWDQDFVMRAGATAAGADADELEAGDRFLPPTDL
jgi:y4mF family transcriptional regulator